MRHCASRPMTPTAPAVPRRSPAAKCLGFALGLGLLWPLCGSIALAQPTGPSLRLHDLCAQAAPPGDVVIPDDGNTYSITEDADCGLITIVGTLQCADGITAEVSADGIMISGPNARLVCGTAASRFDGQLGITIGDDRAFPNSNHGERAIVVMDGGTLELHGQTAKAGFTRLSQDALKDSSPLSVENAAGWEQDDRILVTTTSTYPDQTEVLTLADACPANTCALSAATRPAYFHYGSGQQTYPGAGENGQDLTVDQRAYVANLERNIEIRGADDVHWQSANPKGAHLMVMPGAAVYLDAVALERMGQQKILGRYPLHWHHAGLVTGQYLRNAVIHNSPSRCVALHNTHQAELSNNLCFRIQGHAIFLENGNEIENVITGNLIVDVLEPHEGDELLFSDIAHMLSRWRGPAGIWIASADNTIQGNVVVNAGTGYWHPYVHKLLCYDDPSLPPDQSQNATYGKYCQHVDRSEQNSALWNVEPVRTATRLYEGNVAVATRVGHTWDGAPDGPEMGSGNEFDRDLVVTAYLPASEQVFDAMHAYRSGRTGIYYRGAADTALIKNAVVVEAPIGWFGTGNQDFFDSVFVGIGAAYRGSDPADQDLYYHADSTIPIKDRANPNHLFRAWGLYDGSNHFKNVTFDHPTDAMYLDYVDEPTPVEITPVPIGIFGRAHFANHILEQLHFETAGGIPRDPYRRINLDAQAFPLNWKDVEASESIHDLDGSLFGSPGFIRPDIPFNDLPGDCVQEANIANGHVSTAPSTVLRCAAPTQSIKFQMASLSGQTASDRDFQQFTVERRPNPATVGNHDPNLLFDKFQAHEGSAGSASYIVEQLNFKSCCDTQYDNDHSGNLIWIETLALGDWTSPILIDGSTATNVATSCAGPSDYHLEVWPTAPSGAIHRATSLSELVNFAAPAFVGAYYPDPNDGSLALKLRSNEFLAGTPLPSQHQAQGRFDLVCPVPEPGSVLMLLAGATLLRVLPRRPRSNASAPRPA
ncbi:MAG: hypothetical protein CL908_22755 [Deltaproteobacteria bacterium]|nr:hypothetical protein [Deltaproteobacteria bacterium]